ncbi:lytic murein transglycosylase [Paraglaciecola hydrolytica]|uniref:lytic murein transglycosylase n=1 Tax=Paraglaciecola hydrolytica TaxID=1799789 RepID=UPI0009E71BA1|nr:lytic murein transglycosylase [Paraglaciecola hydrolytica]
MPASFFFGVYSRLATLLLATVSLTSFAQLQTEENQAPVVTFEQCVADLQQQALSAGVSPNTVNTVLGNAKYLAKILEYDRNQPEFVQTFSGYFGARVTPWRINKGREMLAKHKDFLSKLSKQYGVPGHYLVAFWGLETNFGGIKGKMPIVDSLATLACDPRRSTFFSAELIQALRLIERENLTVSDMVGSWAGAMGHTQFMPTAYLTYAKDGDGDGKVDLWNSEQDALESAANFLQHLGWQAGYRWGREVVLPTNFDYQLAGKSQAKTLSFWAKQGLSTVDAKALENSDLLASLLVPAGHTGSAFLVYSNFDTILRWNNSEYYGIAVGHLADRIVGKAPLSKPLPELPKYTLAEMQIFQEKLNVLGYDVGEADGILGPATRKGVRAFQAKQGLIADGYPSRETFDVAINLESPVIAQ